MTSGGMLLYPNQENEVLFAGFNQDQSCFAVGTSSGFEIFDVDPFQERCVRRFPQGGIQHVEMLFKCNILALVGTGSNSSFPPNKVVIWDDQQSKGIGYLNFRADVKSLKMRRDRIVVVLEFKVYVYNFVDLHLVQEIDTSANPKGLCALCPNSRNNVLACLGQQPGQVRVEVESAHKTTHIKAHNSMLSCMALSMDGTKLATASEKGTIIRVFDTNTGTPLRELRRGASRADILSLCFNVNATWMCLTSDAGTVHIFSLEDDHQSGVTAGVNVTDEGHQGTSQNPKSSLSLLKGFLPQYFSSEWSFAQYRVTEPRSLAVFGTAHNSLYVLTASGVYHKISFDPVSGGECVMEATCRFAGVEPEEAS